MTSLKKNFFFLKKMEFVFRKANFESFNGLLRRKILSIAEKCNELGDDAEFSIDFIYDLNELELLNKEEELDENETKTLENTYKENIKLFLVCHQLWQKFGNEFDYLDVVTQKFAIIFELIKQKALLKKKGKR